MATQMEQARKGVITDEMKIVAEAEHQDAESIRERVARGVIAIPANINHKNLRYKRYLSQAYIYSYHIRKRRD